MYYMKREEVTLIFRDIYLVTWHHKWLNQTEQIIAGNKEAALSQQRCDRGIWQKLLRMFGIGGYNSYKHICDTGIYEIIKNEDEYNMVNNYSSDKTYWIVTRFKRFNNKSSSGVVLNKEHIPIGAEELKIRQKCKGKVIINEVGPLGIYVLNPDGSKEKVPYNVSDGITVSAEYITIPNSYIL